MSQYIFWDVSICLLFYMLTKRFQSHVFHDYTKRLQKKAKEAVAVQLALKWRVKHPDVQDSTQEGGRKLAHLLADLGVINTKFTCRHIIKSYSYKRVEIGAFDI